MLLNGTAERIDELEYPLTTDELVTELGESELDLPRGRETIAAALSRIDEETYETPEDARFAVYTGVSDKAIGRKGYSDRDPTTLGSPHGPDELSF